jgi:hypothetical protein
VRSGTGLLVTSLLSLNSWSCGDSTASVGRPKVTIASPANGDTAFSQKPVTFSVTVAARNILTSVELLAGSVSLKKCPGNGTSALDCSADFTPTDVAAQIQNGNLVLTANALDQKGLTGTNEIGVSVKKIRVAFMQPLASGNPPIAIVSGRSPLELSVDSEVMVTQVQVTDGNGLPVHMFAAGNPPYRSNNEEWAVELGGVGNKVLKASVSDSENNTDSAQLNVQVQCQNDGECMATQAALRCCVTSGACYDPAMPMACH